MNQRLAAAVDLPMQLKQAHWNVRGARELSVVNGHPAIEPMKSDFAQARRKLMGQTDVDPKTALLATAPESERWDPLPGSTGIKHFRRFE